MTKVSIIIPAYNVEDYIEECVQSCLNQTSDLCEIICVDDGSTDSTGKILDDLQKQYSKIQVIHQENQGLSGARTSGLKVATGDFICFLDGDDTLHSNVVANSIVTFGLDKNIDLYVYHIDVVYDDPEYPEFRKKKDAEYYKLPKSGLHPVNFDTMLELNVSVCGKVFKRSIIDKHQIDFPIGLHYEDFAFCWKYYAFAESAYYDIFTKYYYRRRQGSIMANTFKSDFNKKILDHIKVFKDVLKFYAYNDLVKEHSYILLELLRYCTKFCLKFTKPEYHLKVFEALLDNLE